MWNISTRSRPGKFIQKGEPLLRIYSPMLVSAQQEYLTALDSGSTNLIADARRRLELWDVPEEQITNLERTRQVEKTLTLVAPFTGWVIERGISAGHKVMTGEPLLVLADLRSVWAEADIYEMDLPYVSTGMVVELSFPHGRDKTFAGKVTLLAPTVDLESRTVKARMEIANPDLLLKPGMYATARLRGDLGEKLAIPETAVMRTGERTYAFKDAGDGRLAPVEIKVGARGGRLVRVARWAERRRSSRHERQLPRGQRIEHESRARRHVGSPALAHDQAAHPLQRPQPAAGHHADRSSGGVFVVVARLNSRALIDDDYCVRSGVDDSSMPGLALTQCIFRPLAIGDVAERRSLGQSADHPRRSGGRHCTSSTAVRRS